jgi:CHAP domain
MNTRNKVNFTNGMRGGLWGNANTWDDNAQKLGYPPNHNPAVGAIAQTDRGKFGHVGWVSWVSPDKKTVKLQQYNAGNNHEYSESGPIAASDYLYIHVKDLAVDTEAPKAPTSLSVTPVGSSPALKLSWPAAHDNVGVSRYTLFLNGKQAGSTSATSYTLSGVSCATVNTVGVRAEDAAGNVSLITPKGGVMLVACLRAQAAGKIVTVTANGTSYVYLGVNDPHPLRWISDTNTYWCVLDGGKQVYNVSAQALADALGNGQPWQSQCLSVRRVIGHIVRETGGTAYTVTDNGTGTRPSTRSRATTTPRAPPSGTSGPR